MILIEDLDKKGGNKMDISQVKVKFSLRVKIKYRIHRFFKIIKGGKACCPCCVSMGYECEYCYPREHETIRTKFLPMNNFDSKWFRIKFAFKDLFDYIFNKE